jgi:hypothetical protein
MSEVEGSLRALAKRCDGRFPPSDREVQAALEIGATSLITLEARLQRLRRSLAGAESDEAEGECEELTNQIRSLLDALSELRSRAGRAGSPLAQGFVFPSDRAKLGD